MFVHDFNDKWLITYSKRLIADGFVGLFAEGHFLRGCLLYEYGLIFVDLRLYDEEK